MPGIGFKILIDFRELSFYGPIGPRLQLAVVLSTAVDYHDCDNLNDF